MSRKSRGILPPGPDRRHGSHTYLTTGKLPAHRAYLREFLIEARAGLVRDHGPTEEDLTMAQRLLIDRVISKLGVMRCLEEWARDYGVIQGGDLAGPFRESYLAYANSMRFDLTALGVKVRAGREALSVLEVLAEDKKAEEKAEKADKEVEGEKQHTDEGNSGVLP
ncbi:MAG: hypothetical protein A2V67_12600 [Deltaproteobacteria bacterium RBG_13_61_14]|nr:MAG: hypothetical protein A2V67_12600 [Deltaproteobacteria bacterium RBG_13_61_14]